MRRQPSALLTVLVLLVLFGLIGGLRGSLPGVSSPSGRADADSGVQVDDEARARTFSYAPEATAEIQGWIAAAMARVHPQAKRLIEAVDGQVVVRVHPSDGMTAGFIQPFEQGFVLSLDADSLRRYGAELRDHVITHELGHVVDLALVPPDLNRQLDLTVPRIGGCEAEMADAGCAPAEERFADTFAKWALNDPVVPIGSISVGYRVAPPANLALWGEPLAALPD